MGCCGRKPREIVSAAASIVKGIAGHSIENMFSLPAGKCQDTSRRTRICQQCDDNTWLTKEEVFAWFKDNGIITVIKNLDDLTKLPPFDKKPYRSKTKLMCTRCKCFIPAKVRDENNHCPIEKW